MVGQTILHYKIIGIIGQGAMGTVYRARDLRLDVERALKFIRVDAFDERTPKARLDKEARAQAKLVHPNIASIFSIESSEVGDFLVQEYVDGPSVDKYLESFNPSLESRLKIILETASALGFAHKNGIIHRDIKPANILVNSEGSAKVTDFGLSKVLDESTLPSSTGIKGTAPYMPPEAFRGESVDERGDVWSLGILAYEMVHGYLPHEGGTFEALAMNILTEAHTPVAASIESKIPGFTQWIETCLAKNKDNRYSNGGEAFVHLHNLIKLLGYEFITLTSPYSFPLKRSRYTFKRIAQIFCIVVGLVTSVLFVRGMEHNGPKLNRIQWESSSTNSKLGKVSWSYDEERFVYTESGVNALHIVNTKEPRSTPYTIPLEIDGVLRNAVWSPSSDVIAVTSNEALYLFDLASHNTTLILEEYVTDLSWSEDGRHLLFTEFRNRGPHFNWIGPLAERPEESIGSYEVKTFKVRGIITETQSLKIRNPRFILGDTWIACLATQMEKNLGIWAIPINGGAPVNIVDYVYSPWSIDWNSKKKVLYFSQFPFGDIYGIKISNRGRSRRRPLLQYSGRPIDTFDYSISCDNIVTISSLQEVAIWSCDINEAGSGFRQLVGGFDDISHVTLNHENNELWLTNTSPDEGMQNLRLSLIDSSISELIPTNIRYRELISPIPTPGSNSSLILRAYDGDQYGIYSYSFGLGSYELLWPDPTNGTLQFPTWSYDGSAIYSVFFPIQIENSRMMLRKYIQSEARSSKVDTLLISSNIGLLCPSPIDNTIFYESRESSTSLACIYSIDASNYNVRFITYGRSPIFDENDNLYIIRDRTIYRIDNWSDFSREAMHEEEIINFPSSASNTFFGKSLAIYNGIIYSSFRAPEQRQLSWYTSK